MFHLFLPDYSVLFLIILFFTFSDAVQGVWMARWTLPGEEEASFFYVYLGKRFLNQWYINSFVLLSFVCCFSPSDAFLVLFCNHHLFYFYVQTVPCFMRAQMNNMLGNIMLVVSPEREEYVFQVKKIHDKTRIFGPGYEKLLTDYDMKRGDRFRIEFLLFSVWVFFLGDGGGGDEGRWLQLI